MQDGWLDWLSFRRSEHFQRRVFLIVAETMRKMRQPVMIADQFTMKLDRSLNTLAAFPTVFTNSRLNSELTLDQVLPRVALLIHFMMNSQALIDTCKITTDEMPAVIRDDFFPPPPMQQSQIVAVQNNPHILLRGE